MTVSRLLNTIYASGAVFAGVYGLSKYIIAPMHEQLTDARHDIYAHTEGKVQEFNCKLEGIISTIPDNANGASKGLFKSTGASNIDDGASDVETVDSDPTELYHRDFGTQTTPNLSRRGSLTASNTDASPSPEDPLSEHESNLKILVSRLQDLIADHGQSTTVETETSTSLSNLKSYLTDVTYQSPYYSYGGSAGSYGRTTNSTASTREDGFEKFKTEIRSFKGMLLSARNFPSRVDAYRSHGNAVAGAG